MSAIEVRNLVKKFHGQTVLHGIDLDVKPGEVVAIIGPSGSGKTTLLRSINLLEQPASALDPELVGEVLNTIRQLAQEKRTMVIVTHEMSFARDVADRAIFMDQGRIVEQGPAKSLFTHPQQPRTRQFLEKFLMQ